MTTPGSFPTGSFRHREVVAALDSTVVSFQHDQEHDDVSALFISRVSMMDDSSGRSGSFGMGRSMERDGR